MFQSIKNQRAQAVMGEYALIFVLAIAMTSAMLVFFRRAIQARIFEGRNAMVDIVQDRVTGSYKGNVYQFYDPYYTDVQSNVLRSMDEKRELIGAGEDQTIFRKSYTSQTSATGVSSQAPAKDAD